ALPKSHPSFLVRLRASLNTLDRAQGEALRSAPESSLAPAGDRSCFAPGAKTTPRTVRDSVQPLRFPARCASLGRTSLPYRSALHRCPIESLSSSKQSARYSLRGGGVAVGVMVDQFP